MEEGKKWVYFISYSHAYGLGNCILERDNPIRNSEDVCAIQKDISKHAELKKIIILNFKVLSVEGQAILDKKEVGRKRIPKKLEKALRNRKR